MIYRTFSPLTPRTLVALLLAFAGIGLFLHAAVTGPNWTVLTEAISLLAGSGLTGWTETSPTSNPPAPPEFDNALTRGVSQDAGAVPRGQDLGPGTRSIL